MLKTHIFDFDGTLVNSMPTWIAKVMNILHATGTPYPEDILKNIVTLGDAGTARYFRDEIGVPLSLEEMFAMMDAYALPRYRDEVPIKDGVIPYLKWLKEQGCTIHVLTASPHKMVDPCLKRLGIFDWFGNVWSTDDFGITKSDPDIYRQAAERIGVPLSDCAFYDDSIAAIRTANEAGIATVGIFDEYARPFLPDIQKESGRFAFSMGELIG